MPQWFPVFGLCLASWISCFSSPAVAQNDLANTIEECEKSLVRIEVKGAKGESLGSGFVVSESGDVVTNLHVMAGAQSAIAIFPNGRRYPITGSKHIDEARDICIVLLKTQDKMTPIKLAQKLPRKGQTVTALGSPLGLSFTATNGIVSAIRAGKELGKEIGDSKMRGTWIQVDTPLSPGNSGGPLINYQGKVVAMSTRASQGVAQNLNFGISAKDINEAIKQAETVGETKLAKGVGKIRDSDTGGAGPGLESIVKKKDVPDSAYSDYIARGRLDFDTLSKRVRKEATRQAGIYRDMRKGHVGIPMSAGELRNQDVVAVMNYRTRSKQYYFRSERSKQRACRKKEDRVNELKRLKEQIHNNESDESLLALLRKAGPMIDTQDRYSIGYLDGCVALHSFNDHEIVATYDGKPFLMWVESTTGLAAGAELSEMPVFVAGTETVLVPGRTTMSLTVLQEVNQDELKEKFYLLEASGKQADSSIMTWRDTTGAYEIRASFIKNDGSNIHLRRVDGRIIQVPISKLDPECLRHAR